MWAPWAARSNGQLSVLDRPVRFLEEALVHLQDRSFVNVTDLVARTSGVFALGCRMLVRIRLTWAIILSDILGIFHLPSNLFQSRLVLRWRSSQ